MAAVAAGANPSTSKATDDGALKKDEEDDSAASSSSGSSSSSEDTSSGESAGTTTEDDDDDDDSSTSDDSSDSSSDSDSSSEDDDDIADKPTKSTVVDLSTAANTVNATTNAVVSNSSSSSSSSDDSSDSSSSSSDDDDDKSKKSGTNKKRKREEEDAAAIKAKKKKKTSATATGAKRKTKTKATGRRSAGVSKIVAKLPYVNGRRPSDYHLLKESDRQTILEHLWDMLTLRGCTINKTRAEARLSASDKALLPFSFTADTAPDSHPLQACTDLRAQVDWKVVDRDGLHVDIYLLSSLGMPTLKLMKIPDGHHAIVIVDYVYPFCLKEKRRDLRIFRSSNFLFDYVDQHYNAMVKPVALWTEGDIAPVLDKYERNITRYPPLAPGDAMLNYYYGTVVPKMIACQRVSITAGVYPYYRVPSQSLSVPPSS